MTSVCATLVLLLLVFEVSLVSSICDGPRLTTKEKIIHIHKNAKFSITCRSSPAFSGNDNTHLNWKRSLDNNTIATNLTSFTTRTLKDVHENDKIWDEELLSFERFTSADAGIYICENEYCNKSISIRVNMEALKKPKVNITETEIRLLERDSYNLTCSVSASPPANLTWIFEGKVVKTCLDGTCTVLINKEKKVTHPYKFNYICKASNELGFDSKSVLVNVLFAPEVERKHVAIYSNRQLKCNVRRANPYATVTWQLQQFDCQKNISCSPHKKWKNITKGHYKVSTVQNEGYNTSELTILTENVDAFFRCLATNRVGSDSDVFRVHIKHPETISTTLKTEVIVAIIIACLFFVILVAGFCYCRIQCYLDKRYAKFLSPLTDYQVRPDIDISQQGLYLPYNPAYEYPRHQLEFIKVLGSGNFGQVWLARGLDVSNWNTELNHNQHTTLPKKQRKASLQEYIRKTSRSNNNKTNFTSFVAVKTLKDDATDSEYKDLASEIKILIYINKHPNIVNLLGACTKGGSLFAILEYCSHGDLKTFLKNSRDHFSGEWKLSTGNLAHSFSVGDAMHFALQIIKGMAFLHSKKLIHRDLACRNILLGDSYQIKISDFGLARDIKENDCYMKSTTGMLPVKWMSPEALFDRLYNTKSDIWSFGVSLWEISTLGGSPYPGIPTEDLFTYISRGYRMSKPDVCPDEFYDVMKRCWHADMEERPEFTELAETVDKVLKEKLPDVHYAIVCNDTHINDSSERLHNSSNNSIAFNSSQTKHQNNVKPRYILDSMIRLFSPRAKRPESTTEHHLLGRLSSSTYSDVIEHNDGCS